MKLAFNGKAKYTDFTPGYELYKKRTRSREVLPIAIYKRIVRAYCKLLSDRLIHEGNIDIPYCAGMIAAAEFTRRPQYRGKKFIGYGKKDWETGYYDGNLKAFGLAYLPVRGKNENMRCYGFVANRKLFKKMQQAYEEYYREWEPVKFDDSMI